MPTPRKKSEPIALVDMDGTIVDYDGAMTRDLEMLRAPEEPLVRHRGPDEDNPPHIEARVRLIRNQPGWWRGLKPLLPGIQMLQIMQQMGFSVHILTKGPKSTHSAWTEKAQWCHDHIPGVPVTVTADKGLAYGKVLMDDWPPYVTRWLEWRPRGLVIMPSWPWNKDFTHPNVIKYDGPGDQPMIASKLHEIIMQLQVNEVMGE